MIIFKTIRMFIFMVVVTGMFYPFIITIISQLTMREKANGSLALHNGKIIGSYLIAQKFEGSKHIFPRPSYCDFDPLVLGASNLGPTSSKLKNIILKRELEIPTPKKSDIPSELLFSSGSGLDPHITRQAAYFQMARVAEARGLTVSACKELIDRYIEKRQFRFLGEDCINVLRLNCALDELKP